MFAFYLTEPLRERLRALFVASVANIKPARLLALDDDLAVQRAQFDLANVTASGIDLLRNQGRAFQAAARSARRDVAASVDANFCWRGIEVLLKHVRGAQTIRLRRWRVVVKRTTLRLRGALAARA